MSLPARWVLALIVLGALAAATWKAWHTADSAGYARAQAEYQAAAERQREANRARARDAEIQQATQTQYRDRFITQTITEVRHATVDLSTCPVPEPARRLLNDAARCASEDRSTACGAGDGLQPPS